MHFLEDLKKVKPEYEKKNEPVVPKTPTEELTRRDSILRRIFECSCGKNLLQIRY